MARKVRTVVRKIPRQARSRETVEAILLATTRVLTRVGYEHCTTNRVAEEAGVSVGSLYQYFPSKEALVTALIEQHLAQIHPAVFAELSRAKNLPLPDVARAMVELVARTHAVNPDLHRVILEQIPRKAPMNKLRGFEQALHRGVVEVLTARKRELRVSDLQLAALVVVAAVDGVFHSAVIHWPARLKDEALIDEATELVVRYLMKPGFRHAKKTTANH